MENPGYFDKGSSETVYHANMMATDPNRVGIKFRYEMNGYELRPFFLGAVVETNLHAVGAGGPMDITWKENAIPKKEITGWPHRHDREESFYFFGLDPDNPDDLGATHEFWMGTGEDAEYFSITKPSSIVCPRNVTHMPFVTREIRKPYVHFLIIDSPLYGFYQVPKLPSGFSVEKEPAGQKYKANKYQKYYMERDISSAAFFPSHEGKAHVLLQYDLRHNEIVRHWMEINLVYGAGIGWGCGDLMKYPEGSTTSSEKLSLPHIHDCMETYCFFGSDPDNFDDLGATIEFWMGEGDQAKQYVINKPTIILVPPFTVHLPLYVRELHSPFVSASFLERPLWSGYYTEIFPPGFEHKHY